MKRKYIFILVSLFFFLLLAIGPLLGNSFLPFSSWDFSINQNAIFELRLIRTLTAVLAGVILAAGGYVFQIIFRNDLATPFTLGVVSGSAFGVALGLLFFKSAGTLFSALFGAGLDLIGIYLFGKLYSNTFRQDTVMVLSGILLSYFFAAGSMLARYLASPYELSFLDAWLMGSFELLDYSSVVILFAVALTFLIFIFWQATYLDMLRFHDDWTFSRGINPNKKRNLFLWITMVAVSILVSLTGPVGFLGLLVPHLVKRVVKGRTLFVLPWVVLIGAILSLVIDILGRPGIFFSSWPALPPGLISSLIGVPFFLWILFYKYGDS